MAMVSHGQQQQQQTHMIYSAAPDNSTRRHTHGIYRIICAQL